MTNQVPPPDLSTYLVRFKFDRSSRSTFCAPNFDSGKILRGLLKMMLHRRSRPFGAAAPKGFGAASPSKKKMTAGSSTVPGSVPAYTGISYHIDFRTSLFDVYNTNLYSSSLSNQTSTMDYERLERIAQEAERKYQRHQDSFRFTSLSN